MSFYNRFIFPESHVSSHEITKKNQRKVRWFLIGAGLIISFISQACVYNQVPIISSNTSQPVQTTEPVDLEPLATITFNVEVPRDTPENQPILLTILDEVTGLALNVSRTEMQYLGEMNYSITLPFPVGAVVKYRYARQDDFIAEEHTSDGRPVRYRLYRVDGPGTVQDVISTWSDTSFSSESGRIMGQVKDAASGEAIPNILVTAGGAQTTSSSNGEFLLEGLPDGVHNLVLYAYNGSYRTFQQGASVAANSSTPVDVELQSAPLVKVLFSVQVPDGTLPAVPIRMAGNLTQLGNTFSNLSGGMNTLASRMPLLTQLPSGEYALELDLPAGAFIEYKYTLGDGFWNAEHSANGNFRVRSMTVPEEDSMVEEEIDNWGNLTEAGPLIFNVTVPESTPEFDFTSIQFHPFGWTEPVPMWDLGENHWVYILYSPLSIQDEFAYRYCRNDQCGRADDALTPGEIYPGRTTPISTETINIEDSIESWYWLDPIDPEQIPEVPETNKRSEEFITGIEIQPHYHPTWIPRFPVALNEISTLQADWIFYSPTWTFSRQTPPLLEPVSGVDPPWQDMAFVVERSHAFDLQVTLNPTPNFFVDVDSWWQSAPRDFPWWQTWFERYEDFLLNFADFAQQFQASGLVIGGDWVTPALPDGILADGSPSGVPADAESRWRDLISEVRAHYDGTLFWALTASPDGINPPVFIEDLDHVYLEWSLPLTGESPGSVGSYSKAAGDYLDREVFPEMITLEMPFTIGITYPSAKGSLQGCVRNIKMEDQDFCVKPVYLEPPFQDDQDIETDLNGQLDAYQALFLAINNRDWIDGLVARGFYPPAPLQDKSASINGKPAQLLVGKWYQQFNPLDQTGE